MNEKLKQGGVPGTLFECSDNGWINQELYIKWFKFFIEKIPPARPVLLIQDGHSFHISLDVIQLARDNGVHLLCLPVHTTFPCVHLNLVLVLFSSVPLSCVEEV